VVNEGVTGCGNKIEDEAPVTVSGLSRAPVSQPVMGHVSRQVDWWSVHEFVEPYLRAAGGYPMAGTVAWQLLSDTDPAKWAALLDAAQHHVLRVDTCQEQLAEASQNISRAADWGAVTRWNRSRAEATASGTYIPRRAS
jgi:hypothetical protein